MTDPTDPTDLTDLTAGDTKTFPVLACPGCGGTGFRGTFLLRATVDVDTGRVTGAHAPFDRPTDAFETLACRNCHAVLTNDGDWSGVAGAGLFLDRKGDTEYGHDDTETGGGDRVGAFRQTAARVCALVQGTVLRRQNG